MMTEREALKLALEALESIMLERGSIYDRAINAIREALDEQPAHQQKPEPVAYSSDVEFDDETEIIPAEQKGKLGTAGLRIALYLGPPAQRKPLTDEEIILIVADCASSHQHTDIHFARAIETAHGIKE